MSCKKCPPGTQIKNLCPDCKARRSRDNSARWRGHVSRHQPDSIGLTPDDYEFFLREIGLYMDEVSPQAIQQILAGALNKLRGRGQHLKVFWE